jgi:molecular chaperone GrpE
MSRKKQAKTETEMPPPVKPQGETTRGADEPTRADVSEAGISTGESPLEKEAILQQTREELEKVRQEATEALDKYLRAKAEVENTRRRAEIDVANARKFGIERFATELLTVRDSLELARTVDIQQENRSALEKMHEGLDLTLKLLDSVFEKFTLTVINPEGEKFDPERHQAMSVVENTAVPPGHVVQVVQKGYMLHERLLRPAMVMVAKAPDAKQGAEST